MTKVLKILEILEVPKAPKVVEAGLARELSCFVIPVCGDDG